MTGPVRVLSDLHLGHRVSRIENVSALRPLVSGAGTVVFNGDTWQELAAVFREKSAVMLEELKRLCAEEGAEAVFLSGNHDPGWEGPGWVELAEGRIVITHGDSLMFAGSPWKREILVAEERVRELWNQHPAADRDVAERIRLARRIARDLSSVEYSTGRHFIQRAWDAAVPPMRAMKMIEAWITQGTVGAQFCERYFPKAEVLLIGHFHREGFWIRNRRLVIDTGSFLAPGRAHWVEWNDGWLTRGVIDETPERCTLGRKVGTWRI